MILASRGIESTIGREHANAFRDAQHPDPHADHMPANPPLNDSDWFSKPDNVRWQFGVAPTLNANFAFERHFTHCARRSLGGGGQLAALGMAGFVLANGGMSSNRSGACPSRRATSMPKATPQSRPRQRDFRRALIEADLVDCMGALPGLIFYSTEIPVCRWSREGSQPAGICRAVPELVLAA